MRLHGAFLKEQGVNFGILVVKSHVLNNHTEAQQTIHEASERLFNGYPVILMAQDSRGTPSYYGRRDIAKFLANKPLQSIPFKEYTFS